MSRYVRADPPIIGIDLDISDSVREGCSVSTLTITAQPVHWKETIKVWGYSEQQQQHIVTILLTNAIVCIYMAPTSSSKCWWYLSIPTSLILYIFLLLVLVLLDFGKAMS